MSWIYNKDTPLLVNRPDHRTEVEVVTNNNHGYPYRARCECGWQSAGYVSKHAAQMMADDHTAE